MNDPTLVKSAANTARHAPRSVPFVSTSSIDPMQVARARSGLNRLDRNAGDPPGRAGANGGGAIWNVSRAKGCNRTPSIVFGPSGSYIADMAWTECQYSKTQINEAGRKLITLKATDPNRDRALEIINNWRSCHGYPLHIVANNLQERARSKVSRNALVARRIKRLPSIAIKLRQNEGMQLSRMQDIGGCRAVLNTVAEVDKLVAVYDEAASKHQNRLDRSFCQRKVDYIQNPKADGYRGVHLIMKYQSTAKAQFAGQVVEIQVRSQYQHAWATAVETCQAFTGQALKSKVKQATREWLRFFALMSSAIAAREKRPLVPGTPLTPSGRRDELRRIEKEFAIIQQLDAWNRAMQHELNSDDHSSDAFLLELNTREKSLKVKSYKKAQLFDAYSEYLEREIATEDVPEVQVVLVAAGSIANLKRAYPNFYVDTSAFIRAVRQEIK